MKSEFAAYAMRWYTLSVAPLSKRNKPQIMTIGSVIPAVDHPSSHLRRNRALPTMGRRDGESQGHQQGSDQMKIHSNVKKMQQAHLLPRPAMWMLMTDAYSALTMEVRCHQSTAPIRTREWFMKFAVLGQACDVLVL
mmetsp:Transcript_1123/g.2069  ORF Transcript_1123/g.2069 Transcript_1123/m.2069 type:complete len:137 (-) Transcript_1123:562-972(-)